MKIALLCTVLLTTACGSQNESAQSAGADTLPPSADTAGSAAAPQQPDSATAGSPWAVRPDGADGVRIGMTFAQLAPLMTGAADTAKIAESCGYVRIKDAPATMRFMVEGRKLVRIEVDGPEPRSAEGAHVGSSEADVVKLYPSARRMPHKYTDGSYLVALPGAPADTLHRYVFETDGQKVVTFRAGLYPQVEYVEGCS